MEVGPMNEILKPLCWLIGHWKSIKAVGFYPTIKSFRYVEQMSFLSVGQPILNYQSVTWNADGKAPMHLESGHMRFDEGTNKVSLLTAQNFGVATVEEGLICDEQSLLLESVMIGRMSFAKKPFVTKISRCYTLDENGRLNLVMKMETDKTPMQEHLNVMYTKTEK
ncbi:unnamed protein product [Brassicogethes aeneus]|uniref:THAP4-like heme-binding domain-containing protein n=1 Tax=Brassicogethes aeneus TaxID=1431903 RepID=A0A9P0AXP1_BRAAE|nr:unnamed protein product [Brassicogethes aeneus]